jgi:hypothetical protein
MGPDATWRADIDALQFDAGNGNVCVVHRLAFRALLRKSPEPAECLDYYRDNVALFVAAAQRKLWNDRTIASRNLHLNSRQIRQGIELGPTS